MKIEVNIKPADQMRYFTLDDYYRRVDDTLVFDIVDLGDEAKIKMMLVHALVEELVSNHRGVTHEEITEFDLSHLSDPEPGEHPEAPYKDGHLIAKGIEMILCGHLGIDWRAYESEEGL